MKKIDFYEVCELIENSVFVDSTDEVRVSDDACSVRITSVGTIDEKGLAKYLFDKLDVSFDVSENYSYEKGFKECGTWNLPWLDGDEHRIKELKKENDVEENKGIHYYDVQVYLDIDIVNSIIYEKFDVTIYDDGFLAIIEGDVTKDEILDRFKEYKIGSSRVNYITDSKITCYKGESIDEEYYVGDKPVIVIFYNF